MSQNVPLICTVGRPPQAVATTVKSDSAQRIVFLLSPETYGEVATGILPLLQHEGVTINTGQFRLPLVHDAEDLTSCVQRIRGGRLIDSFEVLVVQGRN